MEKDHVDMKFYNLCFTLRFPETRNVDFDLNEVKMLKKIRKKGKERVK